jgi:hypothetical protein
MPYIVIVGIIVVATPPTLRICQRSRNVPLSYHLTDGTLIGVSPSGSPEEQLSFTHAARRIWRIALVSRLLVFVVGLWAVAAIGHDRRPLPPPTSENIVLDLPTRWDVGWYVGLASRGYRWDGRADRFETVAFFPAWPALLYASTRLAPHTPVAWGWVGTALATILFVCALAYVYRLTALEQDADAATSACLLLAFYPFGIYFGIPYTESLFLLATVAAFYFARVRAPWPMAGWGVLAGLTRPNGWLLCVPLAVLAWAAIRDVTVDRRVRHLLAAAAFGPLIGMLLYSTYVWRLTGDPFLWAQVQPTWGRGYATVTGLAGNELRFLGERGLYGLLTDRPYDALNMLAFIGAMIAVWPVTRRLGAAAGLWIVINCLPPLVVGGWPSMGRYTSVLFPVFVYLGTRLPPTHAHAPLVLAAFAMGQALAAALFFTSRSLY